MRHTKDVLEAVAAERRAQDDRWGEQNHPDGTDAVNASVRAASASICRDECEAATTEGRLTWKLILREEVFEAFAETDPSKLRAELLQVAAVAVAWVEAIDRRREGAS